MKMLNKTKDRAWMKASHGGHSPWPGATFSNALLIALLAAAMLLSGCSGGASNADPQPSATLSGNWQFTVAAPSDGSYSGGLQGGFLLQSSSSVTGAAIYSVSAANIQPPLTNPCNSGSAPLTGTLTGQNVSLTAVAGTQTFTFTGTLSSNGSTMSGTYSSTAGTAGNGVTPCGTVQSGLAWSAISVPSITGPVQGSFHSTGGSAGLSNQDFLVSGTLTQGQNVGASNVSITGGLSFVNAATNLSDYPCFSFASVVGQISGNSVILQLIGTNGSTVGQIGEPAALLGSTGINPVTFDSAQGGYILHGGEPSYMVASKPCGGTVGTTTSAGDYGNICLALGNSNACQEPISLSPAAVTFPAQVLGTAATIQTITVANNSSITLNNLTLNFSNNGDTTFDGESDFNGLPSFGETDACGAGGSLQTESLSISTRDSRASSRFPFLLKKAAPGCHLAIRRLLPERRRSGVRSLRPHKSRSMARQVRMAMRHLPCPSQASDLAQSSHPLPNSISVPRNSTIHRKQVLLKRCRSPI